ncbi:MAG: hypothetical protein ACXVWZ_00400 [Nocardioides sp.]
MTVVSEPVAPALAARLRRAVLEHVGSEPRRVHPTVLHVGTPGGPHPVFAFAADDPAGLDDQALRADVVAALLRRARRGGVSEPLVWVTRPGGLELQDCDVAWLAAARTAYAEADVPLTLVVVTRRGWRDPRSGVGRVWKRVRPR